MYAAHTWTIVQQLYACKYLFLYPTNKDTFETVICLSWMSFWDLFFFAIQFLFFLRSFRATHTIDLANVKYSGIPTKTAFCLLAEWVLTFGSLTLLQRIQAQITENYKFDDARLDTCKLKDTLKEQKAVLCSFHAICEWHASALWWYQKELST